MAKMNAGQTSSVVATSRQPSAPTVNPKPPPPPLKNDSDKYERGKKRLSESEAAKEVQNKKKKVVTAEGSLVDPVAYAFGGIASRHYIELDVNTRKGRNDEEEEIVLKAGMGDVFFHSLRVLSRKNVVIKDQEKQNKRLAMEIGNLNLKVAEVEKKAAEEARLLKEDAEKARAELAKAKAP